MASSNMFLYWGSGSPPCWRVMLVLEEKQLQGYQHNLLSFDKLEHKSAEVLALNPRGQVPTFKHGDIVLNESYGICLYLENQFKSQGTQLIPDDPKEQALVYQKMFEVLNIFQKVADIYYYRFVPENERTEATMQKLKDIVSAELKRWEEYAQKMDAGSFVAGKTFTMADVMFFPELALAVRWGISQDKYPHLMKYYEQVKDRPSIQATLLSHLEEDHIGPGELLKNV